MAYATVEELQALINIPSTDPGYGRGGVLSGLLTKALEAASERVDRICDRRFVVAGTAAEDRTYRTTNANPRTGSFFATADFTGTPTKVVVDGETLPTDQWRVERPATEVYAGADFLLPEMVTGEATITARWGWPVVPVTVNQVTLLLAGRIFERQKKPLGVMESEAAMMWLPKTNYEVYELLAPYRRGAVE